MVEKRGSSTYSMQWCQLEGAGYNSTWFRYIKDVGSQAWSYVTYYRWSFHYKFFFIWSSCLQEPNNAWLQIFHSSKLTWLYYFCSAAEPTRQTTTKRRKRKNSTSSTGNNTNSTYTKKKAPAASLNLSSQVPVSIVMLMLVLCILHAILCQGQEQNMIRNS